MLALKLNKLALSAVTVPNIEIRNKLKVYLDFWLVTNFNGGHCKYLSLVRQRQFLIDDGSPEKHPNFTFQEQTSFLDSCGSHSSGFLSI